MPDANHYFKNINFDKSWEEEDWERFFEAQDRLTKDYRWISGGPARPGSDPALSFRQVLQRFGMDPDGPDIPPRPFAYKPGEPSEEPLTPPGLKYWQEGADHESLPVYCQAKCYAFRVTLLAEARFAKTMGRTYKSRSHQDFQKSMAEWVRQAQLLPRFLAAAHRLGYDPHGVKGNIVRCRRALEHADACVGLLSHLARRPMTRADYQRVSQETLRLRNALLVWIDLLRTRFASRRSRP